MLVILVKIYIIKSGIGEEKNLGWEHSIIEAKKVKILIKPKVKKFYDTLLISILILDFKKKGKTVLFRLNN